MSDSAAIIVALLTAIPATIAAVSGFKSAKSSRGAKAAAESASDHAETAASNAETAATNAQPVSNGFAAGVRADLAAILAMSTEARDAASRAEDKIDRHIADHARASLLGRDAA